MKSKVYFIQATGNENHDILARKTDRIFGCLGLDEKIEKDSFVGIKIHFGEKGNTGHVKPPWLHDVISRIKMKTDRVFITDTNTLYVGNRSNSVEHLNLAFEHGFSRETLGIPVVIADGLIGRDDDEIQLGLPRVKSAKIASTFLNIDALLCVNHFTGHILTGFGAAIKNLGMGCASRAGKLEQHSDVHPRVKPKSCNNCSICFDFCPADAIIQREDSAFIVEEKCIGCGECLVVCPANAVKLAWDEDSIRVQEKMAEYAYSVSQIYDGKIGFISFLIQITKDCDCMSQKGNVIAEDLGIMGSRDPVALDKASVDLLQEKHKRDVLQLAYDVDGSVQLKHGEKIGLGRIDYELLELS
jgi:uncharacterized Fe-S center protein